MTRTPLIAGNWKMNLTYIEAQALLEDLVENLKEAGHKTDAVEVAVLPPFVDIRTVQTVLDGSGSGIVYGGQDISEHESVCAVRGSATRLPLRCACSTAAP